MNSVISLVPNLNNVTLPSSKSVAVLPSDLCI